MNRESTMSEKKSSQMVWFSDPPQDVMQTVQIVQAFSSMPAKETPAARGKIFFSEPPPDVTQAVQQAE